MRTVALVVLAACNAGPLPVYDPPIPRTSWSVPDGWRSELIPFPLEFAPSLPHHGIEEIRFAPGFFDPAAPGYWSYTFVWRLDDYPAFDAGTIGAELTTYFRGLIDAVDEQHAIGDRDAIVVRAEHDHAHYALAAHVVDAFKTKQPLDLAGTAYQMACPAGALWVFVLAPVHSKLRTDLDALARTATCGQPPVPNKPRAPVGSGSGS